MGIGYNLSLKNLDDLTALESIGGDLMIFENKALQSLTGLGRLSKLGNLYVFSNESLPTCEAKNLSYRLRTEGIWFGTESIWENYEDGSCE